MFHLNLGKYFSDDWVNAVFFCIPKDLIPLTIGYPLERLLLWTITGSPPVIPFLAGIHETVLKPRGGKGSVTDTCSLCKTHLLSLHSQLQSCTLPFALVFEPITPFAVANWIGWKENESIFFSPGIVLHVSSTWPALERVHNKQLQKIEKYLSLQPETALTLETSEIRIRQLMLS